MEKKKSLSMKLKIKLLIALLLILAPFGAIRVWYKLTDNFYIEGIQNNFPYHAEWDVKAPSKKEQNDFLASIQKPLKYLNKGAQVFAFETEDGKYVVKFFKFKHSKPSYFVEILPPIYPFKEYKEAKRVKKLDKIALIFKGHIDAYNHDKEDTGLVWLHLNKTTDQFPNVHIIDKLGRSFTIDLDDIVFVVQKKGVVLRDALTKDLKTNDPKKAEQDLKLIVDLYFREYKKGIYDCDHGLDHNTGFTFDGQSFRFDVGKMSYGEEYKTRAFIEKDMIKVTSMMSEWLDRHFPRYEKEIMKEVKSHVDSHLQNL
jgi:hypothetical protein